MINLGKFSTRLLAIIVAITATIAFAVHSDDAPFKSFTRSVVKQKVSSPGSTSKAKIDSSTPFAVCEGANSSSSGTSSRYDSGVVDQVPAPIYEHSVPPYRGPPSNSTPV